MVSHVSCCSSSNSDEESFDYGEECSYHDIEPFDYGEEPFDNYEESSDDEEESSDEDSDYEHYDDEEASVLLDERVIVVKDKGTDIGKEKYFLEIQIQSKEIFDKQDKTVPQVYDYDHNTKCKSRMENCDLSSDSDNQNKNIDALFQAILYNYFTKVSDLINVTGPNVKIQNTYPLILAVERRYITIIKLLLERKADVNVKNDCGDTALHCSVQPNEFELCSLLLEHGADVNSPNDGNYTPVMLAAHWGYNNILKQLASRKEADLTIRNLGGATALHLAISGSHFDCIETLLEIGGYPKTVIKQQDCPFFHAVDHEYDSVKILELLLQKLGPSIITNNEFEDKLVHHVILHNHIECLKILIKYGADINIRNKFSQTPLHLAVKMNAMDCVSLLVENKAYLELTDERELTPLHFGIYLFHRDNLNEQFFDCNKMREVIICLAKAGAQIHTKNKYGKAPLDDCQDESLRKEVLAVQAEKKPPKTAKIASILPESIARKKRPMESLNEVCETMKKMRNEEMCKICNERCRSIVFGCGHTACDFCANNISECQVCQAGIILSIRMAD